MNKFLIAWDKVMSKNKIEREFFLKDYISNSNQNRLDVDKITMVHLLNTESFFNTVEGIIDEYYKSKNDDLTYKYLSSVVKDYIKCYGCSDYRIRYVNLQIDALRDKRHLSRWDKLKLYLRIN